MLTPCEKVAVKSCYSGRGKGQGIVQPTLALSPDRDRLYQRCYLDKGELDVVTIPGGLRRLDSVTNLNVKCVEKKTGTSSRCRRTNPIIIWQSRNACGVGAVSTMEKCK